LVSLLLSSKVLAQTQSSPKEGKAKEKIQELLDLKEKKDEVSVIYKDMVVVQRKAKIKKGSFLLNPSFTFDFSDGPQTLYGLNLNIGYALSDYWEIYLQTTPAFVNIDRRIVKILEQEKINVNIAKPQFQAGLDLLWLPAYGKDSWGPYSIVRSDTFLKLGIASLKTDVKTSLRVTLAIGKTFFLSKYWNLRFDAGASAVASLFEENQTQFLGIFEMGLMYYF